MVTKLEYIYNKTLDRIIEVVTLGNEYKLANISDFEDWLLDQPIDELIKIYTGVRRFRDLIVYLPEDVYVDLAQELRMYKPFSISPYLLILYSFSEDEYWRKVRRDITDAEFSRLKNGELYAGNVLIGYTQDDGAELIYIDYIRERKNDPVEKFGDKF